MQELRNIADRLWIPLDKQAILWDMDGVLIDSLSLDLTLCNQLLAPHFGPQVTVPKELVRSLFAYDSEKFWTCILDFVEKNYHLHDAHRVLKPILDHFDHARRTCAFTLNPGILEILQSARRQSLKMAVVSNNLTVDVVEILKRAGIFEYFDQMLGNDIENFAKKPAPDTYLLGARLLEVAPQACVVIEDSLIGLEAGSHAHCYTLGVATGGTDFNLLEQTQRAQQVYSSFEPYQLSLNFGDVKHKKIKTPNDFVSHMIEHIAWRLGVEIDLAWYNNDWTALGHLLGKKILEFPLQCSQGSALGMIDDGSAEVSLEIKGVPNLHLSAIENVNLEWFLSLRCEQISSGKPLVALLEGLVQGFQGALSIKVCGVEDPHHTWEGVFRSLGIVLNKLFTPQVPFLPKKEDYQVIENVSQGELSVLAKSLYYSKIFRGTAESHVMVCVDFSQQLPNRFLFNVASSIEVSEFTHLLERLAQEGGFTMQVEFNATDLNSSHVVCEDTALVLGRALLEILTLRMLHWGVHGAGSSIAVRQDLETQAIRVGISVEGRKFWKFVPFKASLEQVRREFMIGQSVYQKLRSEDLDDFLDGLAGGLACSIIIHMQELPNPHQGWQWIFENLGKALRETFSFNPYRKGVPPGVKATLS